MEPTDPFEAEPVDRKRHAAADRRGLAMFGVLVLVVIFTLLGVGAITLATRENQNSGSVLDIKSRQSAAYAGLMFALGEFQRDPANFVALLEAWRTKSVYGTVTNPLPPLYLKFSSSGAAVQLTKTKPSVFAIPGTPYSIAVELAARDQEPAPQRIAVARQQRVVEIEDRELHALCELTAISSETTSAASDARSRPTRASRRGRCS